MASTGYGPRSNARLQRLIFDGDESRYELWEARFLGYLQTLKLSTTILSTTEEINEEKNSECYAELIQLLDDKSLSLVMRDAAGDGRKALSILRDHYASQGKPRIISLYTELTSLEKGANESVTDYLIRAERSVTALKNAKETLSDGLVVAMILKGLPESYKPFAVHITQSSNDISFSTFKSHLKSFEETEKFATRSNVDQIMKAESPSDRLNAITCYNCGEQGHMKRRCPNKMKNEVTKWCAFHKSSSHTDEECHAQKKGSSRVNQAIHSDHVRNEDEHSFAFYLNHSASKASTVPTKQCKGLLVDTGATSHIITTDSFIKLDRNFKPEKHYMELADGTKQNNVALKRGDAEITLEDNSGQLVKAILRDALFIPTYPQDIFSVKAAVSNGAQVEFSPSQSQLKYQDGTVFEIKEHERLYYLTTYKDENMDEMLNASKVSLACSIQRWHEILGHCNFDDVIKLENAVNGMKISGKVDRSQLECTTCIQGKFINIRNRKPDSRARKILEKVHVDLAGPVSPVSKNGFKYCIAFTDDFSGCVFVYFLRDKTKTLLATKKFLADVAPYGHVKCVRSDNGTEFTCSEFKSLLRERGIKHETSCPDSPHQNGTAERHWRTLFEMARCLMFETNVPKYLWPYALQTAAHIRNRCINNRTNSTPYSAFTGVKPNLSKMWVFGSECFAYKHNHKKLDARCTKGLFVGYDKDSPAYLVYHPDSGKVLRHRLVKFMRDESKEHATQTDFELIRDSLSVDSRNEANVHESAADSSETGVELQSTNGKDFAPSEDVHKELEDQLQTRVYPQRERKAPEYFGSNNSTCNMNVDYCYKSLDLPITYADAMKSTKAPKWEQAMKEELDALRDNDTFELTTLPEGKNLVGGKWVYTMKEGSNGVETFKARYVAKGYSQVHGLDYEETFSPTANITSIRVLMQLASQYDFIIHQMDVKTAFLHAPIEHEIYIEQPEGFEKFTQNGSKLVLKLKKSLYGLKQSGRNWNKLLHDYLLSVGFEQNPVDHCIYQKNIGKDVIYVLVWVDDLLIASNVEDEIVKFKGDMSAKFRMKDLGEVSFFLGIEVVRENGKIKMRQRKYVEKMLEKFGMSECKIRATPCEPRLDYGSNGEEVDSTRYREIVGSLIYLMTCTRPDISFIVSKLSQKLSSPTIEDMVAAKHVLRYLKGTIDYELSFGKANGDLSLVAYSDADWASSVDDRHSTSGFCFSLSENGPPISWKSKKQPTIALSSCEAEYISLAATVQESLYLMQLLASMTGNSVYSNTKIYEDNQGAIALSKNPINRQRCKHIDIKYHFIREEVINGRINIVYCATENMVGDLFTKPFSKMKLEKFRPFLFGT